MHSSKEKSERNFDEHHRKDPADGSRFSRSSHTDRTTLNIGARDSPLSRAQFEEFAQEFPHLSMKPVWVKTPGDLDKITSLRTLGKTDFFTRDLDQMLLEGKIDGALHSAKDLPDPLPQGIRIAILTEGKDPRDALVLRDGEMIKPGMVIATSSNSREERVKQMCEGLLFTDIRGTIGERLQPLYNGKIDGVVIAEAALIRLKLTHLNRIFLPGESTPLQGRLAMCVADG